MAYKGDCAAPAARFFCLHPVLLSLSCVLVSQASDSAPSFFFVLPKKETVARRRKLCIARFHGGVKTDSRRCVSFPPHKRCAGLCGGFWASSKGLCAFPDAQPLTLAVCAAWRCHCRFHSVRLNREEAENLLKRPALPRRTTRDSAMPHLPNPTAQTSAAFVRWKGDAAA